MKAKVQTRISPEKAKKITEGAIAAFRRKFLHNRFGVCVCDLPLPYCTCGGKHESITWYFNGVSAKWDKYGAELKIFLGPSVIMFQGITASGTKEAVAINNKSGRIVYLHRGPRRSGGGSIWDLLPDIWKEINHSDNWSIIYVETSQPDWGVKLPLLKGQIKKGPWNQAEANLFHRRFMRNCGIVYKKILGFIKQ